MIEPRIAESQAVMPPQVSEPRLILVTQGRDSGRSEAALLYYRRINNDFLVIASNEHSKVKPDWYLNLKKDPNVRVEIFDASFHAKASTPTGAERVRLLPLVGELLDHIDTSIPRETSAILLSPIS